MDGGFLFVTSFCQLLVKYGRLALEGKGIGKEGGGGYEVMLGVFSGNW